MTGQIVSVSAGTLSTALGAPAVAAFHPMPDGNQQVVVGAGFDENASNALVGLPAVLEAYDDLAGFMTAMGVFCATEKKLDLKSWVSAVVKDLALNVQMQSLAKAERFPFMIEIASAEAELLAK